MRRAVLNTRHGHAAVRPKQPKMSSAEKVAVRRVKVRSTFRKVGGGVVSDIVANARDKRHALEEYFEERLNMRKEGA